MFKRVSALVACVVLATPAFAGTLTQGEYLGTFGGNDNEASVAAALGIEESMVNFLAKVDWPNTEEDGLSISDLILDDDDEPVSGEWMYTGGGVVDLIVIKAGPEFAIYLYDPGENAGIWDTSGVEDRGLSHITAYQLKPIPIPAAVWLMASGLFGLGLMRRRC